jgi:hypothetical protein
MSHPMTDPILLTAICSFALDLFECEELRYDQKMMEPFHKNLSDMKYLIPYLGFGNYLSMMERSKRYHMAQNPGHKVLDQNDFYDFKKPNVRDQEDFKESDE